MAQSTANSASAPNAFFVFLSLMSRQSPLNLSSSVYFDISVSIVHNRRLANIGMSGFDPHGVEECRRAILSSPHGQSHPSPLHRQQKCDGGRGRIPCAGGPGFTNAVIASRAAAWRSSPRHWIASSAKCLLAMTASSVCFNLEQRIALMHLAGNSVIASREAARRSRESLLDCFVG